MTKIALVDYWTCDFGDSICHKWTVGKSYNIMKHTKKEIVEEEIIIITYDISSDSGTTENIPRDVINKDMMFDTFGIRI